MSKPRKRKLKPIERVMLVQLTKSLDLQDKIKRAIRKEEKKLRARI